MTDASFEKISQSDKPLYGVRKLLLCGFPSPAQPKFKTLLGMLGIEGLPLVWAATDDSENLVGDLFERPDDSGAGADSRLPRAIIVAGIAEAELHLLMSGCRKAGMQQALWAALTPTSEKWHLKDLLKELAAEREALARR